MRIGGAQASPYGRRSELAKPVFAEDLRFRTAQHLTGAAIRHGDPPVGVEGHEQHRREVEVLPDTVALGPHGRLGQLALGDVAGDDQDAGDLAIPDDRVAS